MTSPLGSVRLFNPCEEYVATQKHGKYDKDFEGVHYSFAAMVWETLGAINVEGEEVLRQILSFAAKRIHREFSSFCGRFWAQFSCVALSVSGNLATCWRSEVQTEAS